MASNKELWLIQWPVNQTTDFDRQEITLKLQRNGNFASFETLSGKSYELLLKYRMLRCFNLQRQTQKLVSCCHTPLHLALGR
ncbi:hypothetical protein IFM89_011455 [Coptis chinensis]|uniref:Uncharacterized protein n=1 Tax=Coptis chinensis TaxID=261450 RepID=A0A835IXI0_9MAGN|nr:hypothetical protein IFM89_011455 [Coptis chinensis]